MMGYPFCVSAAFALAKTLRDAHDNALAAAGTRGRSVCAACERE
jgi:hypothetical protein